MDTEERIASLAVIGSGYQSRTTVFTTGVAGIQTIIEPDRRRFAIRFYPAGGGTSLPPILPLPIPSTVPSGTLSNTFIEYTFGQWPGIVNGGFGANFSLGGTIIILEQLYLR